MHETRYKGFILQRAYCERASRDVARRSKMNKQPGNSWYVKQPVSGKVLDSRLTKDSAKRAVNALLAQGVMPEGELV